MTDLPSSEDLFALTTRKDEDPKEGRLVNRIRWMALGIVLPAMFWTFSAWGYEVVEVKNGGTVAGRIHFQGEAPAQKKLHITKNENVCGVKPLFS